MPELPEVETTRRGIQPHLQGHTITRTSIYNDRLRWPIPQEITDLSQAKVLSITRRAKYLIIETNQGGILIHLGMSGSLRVCEPDMELRKHDHVIFHLDTNKELRYHDPRRFGCVLYDKDACNHPLLQKLGPEPLEEEFSLSFFYDRCQQSNATIKQHIMNNKIVVGVGNIYASEALFLSNIRPTRLANQVSKPRLTKLHHSIRSVLQMAIQQGGTTLRDFLNQDGSPGYFQQQLYVYGREGEACRICGATIKKITLGQRSTFYCPKCQR